MHSFIVCVSQPDEIQSYSTPNEKSTFILEDSAWGQWASRAEGDDHQASASQGKHGFQFSQESDPAVSARPDHLGFRSFDPTQYFLG